MLDRSNFRPIPSKIINSVQSSSRHGRNIQLFSRGEGAEGKYTYN